MAVPTPATAAKAAAAIVVVKYKVFPYIICAVAAGLGHQKHARALRTPLGLVAIEQAGERMHVGARALANRFFARSYRRRIRSRGLRCALCSTQLPHAPPQQVPTPAASLASADPTDPADPADPADSAPPK